MHGAVWILLLGCTGGVCSTDPKQHSMQLKSYVGMPAMEVFKSKCSQSVRPRGGRRAPCWPGSAVGEGEPLKYGWTNVCYLFSPASGVQPRCVISLSLDLALAQRRCWETASIRCHYKDKLRTAAWSKGPSPPAPSPPLTQTDRQTDLSSLWGGLAYLPKAASVRSAPDRFVCCVFFLRSEEFIASWELLSLCWKTVYQHHPVV